MLAGRGWLYFLALMSLTVSNAVSVMLSTFTTTMITIFLKKKNETGFFVILMENFILMTGITGQ
ncbi:hypothetical protein EWS92_23395 [Vibrio vulnificus]|nr:hypothetical protein FORC17_p020 [Vibrio vulnificus]EGR0790798.1 hypothetical protein [Vibrio vulnificus]EGR0799909.1 hypothetical protein [Vibrio vulnificus]EGR0817305.1 hypothetical protein [Vibrio vulnificus]EGR0879557.1 hypothetical protein [Vibrio vulnificus]